LRAKPFVAGGIRSAVVVLPAVNFNDQAALQASKIRNVRTHRMLASEAAPVQLPTAQMQPQTPLCVRHVAAQMAGESGFGTLSHGLAPIPAFPRKRGKEKCALCPALCPALCLALCL